MCEYQRYDRGMYRLKSTWLTIRAPLYRVYIVKTAGGAHNILV